MVSFKSAGQKNNTRVSIAGIKPGTQVELVSVDAGCSLRGRLLALGFIKGSVITVISNEGNGPLLVKLGESRLTIGRGMAERMQVQ